MIAYTSGRYILLAHSFDGSSGNPTLAQVKIIIEGLAAARLAGKAFPVTARTLMTANCVRPVWRDATTQALPRWNILPGGGFNGTLTQLAWCGFTFGASGITVEDGGPTVADLPHRQGVLSGKCLQFSEAQACARSFPVTPNRHYLISLDTKQISGSGRVRVRVYGCYSDAAGAHKVELQPIRGIASGATWQSDPFLVFAPDWCDALLLQIFGTAGSVVQVTNLGCDLI
jgi:hypothetical protein